VPNEYSALPTILVQCLVAAACFWFSTRVRQQLAQLRNRLKIWEFPRLVALLERDAQGDLIPGPDHPAATQEDTHPWRRRGLLRWPAIFVVPFPFVLWELYVGPPIVDPVLRSTYLVIWYWVLVACAWALGTLWKATRLSADLAEQYPLEDDHRLVNSLPLLREHFRILIRPFVEMTYFAAGAFAAIVISRTRFFDAWDWSGWVILVCSAVALGLLWLLFDLHRHWHQRMVEAKELYVKKRTLGQSGGFSAGDLASVPDWAWNPVPSLRVLASLITPLMVVLLQNNQLALGMWGAVSRLIGG
jgi:hypothetical protein